MGRAGRIIGIPFRRQPLAAAFACFAFAALLGALACRAIAQVPALSGEHAALIVYKALAYDRHVSLAPDSPIVVVYFHSQDRVRADLVAETFRHARGHPADSSPASLDREIVVGYSDRLLDQIPSDTSLIYLVATTPVLTRIEPIAKLADDRGIVLFSEDASHLGRGSAFLIEAVERSGRVHPQIAVDLEAAERQGIDFAAEFLRLCRVVSQ